MAGWMPDSVYSIYGINPVIWLWATRTSFQCAAGKKSRALEIASQMHAMVLFPSITMLKPESSVTLITIKLGFTQDCFQDRELRGCRNAVIARIHRYTIELTGMEKEQ